MDIAIFAACTVSMTTTPRVPYSHKYTSVFAFFGISRIRLNFAAPGMRFPSYSVCTRLSEMLHLFAASGAKIYYDILSLFLKTFSATIIYGQPNKHKKLKNSWNFPNFSAVGIKENFLRKLFQRFAK